MAELGLDQRILQRRERVFRGLQLVVGRSDMMGIEAERERDRRARQSV